MKNMSRAVCGGAAAGIALAALSPILAGCKPKGTNVVVAPGAAGTNTTVVAPGSTLPTKAAPTPGQEVAEVKAMIGDMKNVKDMQGLSEFFTNDSAGALGMLLMIPVAMMAAFEDMGGQMSAEMNKQFGGGQAQPPAPQPSKGPKIKAEMEATLKKYGISDKTQPGDPQAKAVISSRGRELLRDMAGLLSKLDTKGKGGDDFGIQKDKMPDPEDATYQVLSPTRVKITQKNPKDKMMENMEARFEDGRWRLHIGDFDELMKKSGMNAMPAGPGAMGGMPGAPPAGAGMGAPPGPPR